MAKEDLMKRVLKATGNPLADVFKDSKTVAGKQELIPCDIPMLNVALSGKWDGGLAPGVTIVAAPSKHFKSMLGLVEMKAFQDKFPTGICVFIDSEFGFGSGYMESIGIDTSKVLHVPIVNIEEAKFQIMAIFSELEKENEKLFILYDSLGNTASKKEMDDAVDQKSVADMSRAKSIKSFFRIITPKINLKQYYMFVVNHIYSCLDKSQNVLMSDNTRLSIDKIEIGDVVQTINGPRKVLDTFQYNIDTYIEIILDDGKIIKCTPNHKFMINGDWIEAEFLCSGMNLDTNSSKEKNMKIVSMKIVNESLDVYDIMVESEHHYILENGLISHNSQGLFPTDVQGGGCVVAGTKIQMHDGELRDIIDVAVNDAVKTLNGPKRVTHTWNPDTLNDGTPECYKVIFEDGSTCVVSAKHRFLTHCGWKEITDLSEGDDIISI